MPRKHDTRRRVWIPRCLGIGALKKPHGFFGFPGGGNRICSACEKLARNVQLYNPKVFHE